MLACILPDSMSYNRICWICCAADLLQAKGSRRGVTQVPTCGLHTYTSPYTTFDTLLLRGLLLMTVDHIFSSWLLPADACNLLGNSARSVAGRRRLGVYSTFEQQQQQLTKAAIRLHNNTVLLGRYTQLFLVQPS